MTVAELIEKLKEMPQNAEVVVYSRFEDLYIADDVDLRPETNEVLIW